MRRALRVTLELNMSKLEECQELAGVIHSVIVANILERRGIKIFVRIGKCKVILEVNANEEGMKYLPDLMDLLLQVTSSLIKRPGE